MIAPTKDAAGVWSNRLGEGGGLSVLNYVMPLKERRRLSAEQVAAFQVVVTTYDVRATLAVGWLESTVNDSCLRQEFVRETDS